MPMMTLNFFSYFKNQEHILSHNMRKHEKIKKTRKILGRTFCPVQAVYGRTIYHLGRTMSYVRPVILRLVP